MPAAATYTAYPTGSEVEAFMTAAGITLPSGFDGDYHAFQASDAWESLTRYVPFLAPGSTSVFKFDPPGPNRRGPTKGGGRRLLLSQAFATVTEVKVGVTTDSAGTVLTADEDYFLRPSNALQRFQPVTEIEFAGPQFGLINSIRITGKPGYSTQISAEVWNAIRELAAGMAAYALREALSTDAIDWKEGDVSERSSIELIGKLGDTWVESANKTARRYRFMQ